MDVVAVVRAARTAVAEVRGGGGPVFLELRTYRFRAHSMFDPELYRDKAEVELWKQRGPLHTFTDRLKAEGVLSEDDFQSIEAAVTAEVRDAIEFAEASPIEPVEDLLRDVHTPAEPHA
jgi:pyruvate dehydrogenase E1 component alpha subunit